MIVVAAVLFIVAYQSLAALLYCWCVILPLGLSLVAIIASPAFGYAGRRLAGAGNEWLFAQGLGRIAADALVSADPVRPGGARIAGARLARTFAILAGMATRAVSRSRGGV